MAKLYFKYSAMNAGKTTILLQAAHNYEEQGMKVLVVKPLVDTKGDEKIVSRLGIERTVDYRISKDQKLYNFMQDKLDGISCLLVDEAQFLQEKQVDDLLRIVCDYDIPVICYGLRTDFRTKGFPGSTRLLEIADKIEEIKTMCRCGSKAVFNSRMVNGEFTYEGDQVAIDGEQNVTYESVCPKCYYKKIKFR